MTSIFFNDILRMSLDCELAPVLCPEYEYDLRGLEIRKVNLFAFKLLRVIVSAKATKIPKEFTSS